MSVDQNKAVVRRLLVDGWGKRDTAVLDQVLARDVCDHNPSPGQPRGLEGQRWFLEQVHRAVPDTTVEIEQLMAEGDLVADHWVSTGTQTGEFLGIPATGKRFTITGTDMMRVENGKIVEMWHQEDTLGMMQQLGVMPVPQPSGFQETARRSSIGESGEPGRGRTLSEEEKRAMIRRGYQEFIDKGNASAADTLLTPDFVGHFSAAPVVNGREAFKQFISMFTKALSNHRARVEDILVEGDYAACRATFTGRHTGDLFGIPASGKEVNVESVSIFRFAGDRVAEQWANNNDAEMMRQIGAVAVFEGMPVPEPC